MQIQGFGMNDIKPKTLWTLISKRTEQMLKEKLGANIENINQTEEILDEQEQEWKEKGSFTNPSQTFLTIITGME